MFDCCGKLIGVSTYSTQTILPIDILLNVSDNVFDLYDFVGHKVSEPLDFVAQIRFRYLGCKL